MPKVVQTFLFEGRQMTVSEIRKLVPRHSDTFIRRLLAKGMTTAQQMLTYRPPVAKPGKKHTWSHNACFPKADIPVWRQNREFNK